MPRLLAGARVVVFVVLLLAAGALSYQTVHTWRLFFLAGPKASSAMHYFGFTSSWTFFLPSLLVAATVALGGAALLRDRHSGQWARVVYEIAYVLLALYTFHVLWRTLYHAYDPSHSGPLL
jgi:hypothetical protein